MGIFEFLEKAAGAASKSQDRFNRQVRDKCDEIDCRLDEQERRCSYNSEKLSEIRRKNDEIRNNHS